MNIFQHHSHLQQQQQSHTTNWSDQSNVKSFREQIDKGLMRWHQLQQDKLKYEQQKQIEHHDDKQIKTCPIIDFDQIMEEDLENQLKELERQEEEEYLLLERSLEEQSKQEESNKDIKEFEEDYVKQLEYIEILQKFQQNEQQQYTDTLTQELKKYENLVKQFKNLFKNQYQSKQKLCLTPGNDSEFHIRQRKHDHYSIMEWLVLQIITMFYNSTGMTYFDIPMSANESYHMQLNDTIKLFELADKIKALKIYYRGDLTTPSPMKIEKECTTNINELNLTIIIFGISSLIILNFVIFIWNTYSIYHLKKKKQAQFLLQSDVALLKKLSICQHDHEDLYASINL
ncbi:unnamed protein product [Rotaria magnacalcarata]|uniref:Transmembrane protein n=3 Tax=Rotaria magnacalcarata TaxID=392030 RepID=A0A816SST4_9BILA|nr:unnamed protein product [Rotaria magnacalcarata]CAF4395109.1 unnamed protein product [Rotaria magnacalcarata]